MIIPLRHTTTSLFLAIATFAAPALAQNAAPATAAPGPAATAATGYGTPRPAAAANARGVRQKHEDQLLGAPRQYGTPDAQQGNTDDAQQAALLDEQRMTVLGGGAGGQPALGKGLRNKAPGAANGKVQAAGQPGRPNAANGLMPAGAAKTTYADPYDPTGPGKHSVYRSPW